MKSYHANKGAGLVGLTIKEHDMPVPGPREVLVRVRACALSFRELLILILGYYPLPVRSDVVVLATCDIRSEKSGDVPRTSRRNNPLVLAP